MPKARIFNITVHPDCRKDWDILKRKADPGRVEGRSLTRLVNLAVKEYVKKYYIKRQVKSQSRQVGP